MIHGSGSRKSGVPLALRSILMEQVLAGSRSWDHSYFCLLLGFALASFRMIHGVKQCCLCIALLVLHCVGFFLPEYNGMIFHRLLGPTGRSVDLDAYTLRVKTQLPICFKCRFGFQNELRSRFASHMPISIAVASDCIPNAGMGRVNCRAIGYRQPSAGAWHMPCRRYSSTNTDKAKHKTPIARLDRGQKHSTIFAAAPHGQRPSGQQLVHEPHSCHPQLAASWLPGPVPTESPHPEVYVEPGCQVTTPPIVVDGNSGKLPCSVAEEALPQTESIPTPIVGLNAELLAGAVIETPTPPSDDSRALTWPNPPLPDPVPQANPDLGVTRVGANDGMVVGPICYCDPFAVLVCGRLHQWASSCMDFAISGLGGLKLLVSGTGTGHEAQFTAAVICESVAAVFLALDAVGHDAELGHDAAL
ncbi:hypothetical protein Nepgr_027731 [Nepenthes gracilis]|uniref:Uncharacterized protein n=1 Tax=Nepenthes gracilis TaxID=150966 RepID=A0AAD3Y1P2_NEPGR|nr:hypothetical protein Nepgr_027731 [Nepenthes gracilis]